MKPSEESPQMEEMLDYFTGVTFGRSRKRCIESDVCVSCGGEAKEFKDDLSRKEFTISGMCQVCQDKVFGGRM